MYSSNLGNSKLRYIFEYDNISLSLFVPVDIHFIIFFHEIAIIWFIAICQQILNRYNTGACRLNT